MLRCGMCKTVYGTLRGKYPSGTMTCAKMNSQVLPGYEGNSSGTWKISYSLQGGTKADDNIKYNGDARTAYLPINKEGNEILALL